MNTPVSYAGKLNKQIAEFAPELAKELKAGIEIVPESALVTMDQGRVMVVGYLSYGGKFVGKKGDKIDYTYDFGDCNEVEITLLGTVAKPSPKEFATEGPDAVEDSAGVGGIAGIVALAKQGKGKEYKQVSEWLRRVFKKRIDDVLDYPSVRDIYTRVFSLVKTASTANPKSVSTCWLDYLVVR